MYSQGYFIDVQICIVALYLLYIAFFHHHISHGVARLYLLLLVPVSLVIPSLELPLLPAVKNLGEEMIGSVVETTSQIGYVVDKSVNYYGLIYVIGVGLMFLWLSAGLIKLFILLRNSHIEKVSERKIIYIKGDTYAFTVLNYIFINEKFRNTPSASELIAHEIEHVKMYHSFDLLYMSLLRVSFWFNPIVWHLRILLRQLHEYQVDRRVVASGHSLASYINLLIKSEAGISPELTSSFGYSFTKKRIAMLVEKKRINNCKRLFIALPVLGFLLFAFSLTTRAFGEQSATENCRDTVISMQEIIDINMLKDPVFVYDGRVITKKEYSALNRERIESVTVLKDKMAEQIYGEAGKNGVVIVESKDGAKLKVTQKDDFVSLADSAVTINFDMTTPLYIIDGVEATEKEFKQLVMESVKSVTVLKKSVARAMYGAKGGNGVIVVETSKSQIDSKVNGTEVVVKRIPSDKSTVTITSVTHKIKSKSDTLVEKR